MNKNFRKWLACAIAVTIAVYNAPYSVEALEVIGDSVQMDSVDSLEGESGDTSKPEDDGVQNSDVPQAGEEMDENTTEQNQNDDEVLTQAGAFKVSGEQGKDWTFSDNGELNILQGATDNMRIEGDRSQTTNRVLIQAGYKGTVTIKDLNIDSKVNWSRAFEVQSLDGSTTKVELILEGENNLKSGYRCSGLKFEGKGNGSSLTISGDGKLTAIGNDGGAGIGGDFKGDASNITIKRGTIIAKGGEMAAGIGGGYDGSGNNIKIEGGTVIAIGGEYIGNKGDGIGTGCFGQGNNITISGGSVNASSIGVTPKDENGNPVYLVRIERQGNVTNVKVDGKDYNVSHPNDDNALYLYMPIGTHIITTNETSYKAIVNENGLVELKETDAISIDKTSLQFGVKNVGYSIDNLSQSVTITNEGSKEATLKKIQNTKYDVDLPNTIAPGGTATITITPKENLSVGKHNETITIETDRGATVEVNAEFGVNEALNVSLSAKETSIIEGQSTTITANVTGGSENYTYKWYVNNNGETSLKGNEVRVSPNETTTYKVEVSDGIETKTGIVTVNVTPATYTIKAEPESLDFGGKEEGYKIDKLSKDVKITNTGNTKVTLKDLTNTKYDVVLPTNKEIESGQTATITITPKKDLAVGEHNEAITIATDQGSSVTVNAKFKVNSSYVPSKPSKPEQKPEEKPGIGVEVDVVDKIAGENRYDTSVSISQKVFPSKSEKVYLVSGEKFPDALSSAALTGKGDGPILLINDKNIDKILSEIDRLDAKEIVFIGGNSVSDANEAKIRKFAKENSSVVKYIVGKDRYETSVKVAEQTISKYGNKGKVIIADGRNYPDAVSIASYAAKEGIPVILVNGNKVPDVVKSFLNKYKISNAIIVGGNEAVGKDVEKLFKSVDRVAGADRYDTSKKIAEKFFSGSSTVFVASGESFADSLSVSYYAGAKNAPILLTKSNSLDNDTREYLEKNKDKDYIIVGGDEAINPDLFK